MVHIVFLHIPEIIFIDEIAISIILRAIFFSGLASLAISSFFAACIYYMAKITSYPK